jgi:hypothetical protein
MLMNRLRGKVADRPIDTRVIRDKSAVPLPARVQRATSPVLGYQPEKRLPATDSSYTMPAPSFMDRLRSLLDRMDSFESDIHIGDVPVYEKG